MSKSKKKAKAPTKTELRNKELAVYEKMKASAARKQQANRKLRDKVRTDPDLRDGLRDMLVKDLLRVYNDPNNPYAGWAASRKRYRELGHFPEILITDVFGNHQEFQRAAGLHDPRGTAKVKNLIARLSTEEKIRAYAEEGIEPYYGIYDEKIAAMEGTVRVMVVADIHGKWRDPFAWSVFLDCLKRVKPHILVMNGDVVDFPKVGRYTQMPGAGNLMLQEEINYVKSHIFAEIREIYDGPLIWTVGNHEQRLVRYLADTSPSLADLDCLRFDQLFGVADYDIEMVFGGSFLAPYQRDRSKNIARTHKKLFDCFVISHGTAMGPKGVESELQYYGMSGTSGHTHRPAIYSRGTEACPGMSWTNPGMMAHRACAKDYRETRVNEWTNGFAVFTIQTGLKRVVPELCIIHEDFAAFCGQTWTPTQKVLNERHALWSE